MFTADRVTLEDLELEVPGVLAWARAQDTVAQPVTCATCVLYANESLAPRHDASPRCQSGRRPHCTCDTCF